MPNRELTQAMCIIALDFDGVLCDSAAETAKSGWKAGHRLWPDRFPVPIPSEVVTRFRQVRPILKTGFHSLAMLHMLYRGISIDAMLFDGLPAVNAEIARLGVSERVMQDAFGAVRDEWITDDFDGWLKANGFYSIPVNAAKRCTLPLYIVTTKQTRFAVALCRHIGLQVDEARILGLEHGEKSGVLSTIQSDHPDTPLLFIEDRLDNLRDVRVPNEDEFYRFYADWGYGTKKDRAMAEKSPHITVIDPPAFDRMLRDPAPFLV